MFLKCVILNVHHSHSALLWYWLRKEKLYLVVTLKPPYVICLPLNKKEINDILDIIVCCFGKKHKTTLGIQSTDWDEWMKVVFVFPRRVLGWISDEQRHSRISPVTPHRRPGPGPAAPPSGGGRGGHGGGAGARPVIVLDPQRRHGEDPAGRTAWVESQQLLLWQVVLKGSSTD